MITTSQLAQRAERATPSWSPGRKQEPLAIEKKPAVMEETLEELRAKLQGAEAEVDRLKRLLRRRSVRVLHLVHELRAPLASVQTCLDVLLQGHSSISALDQEEMLRLARDRARALLGLVNDLLHLAGVQHAEMQREAVPVQLADVLRRVAPELRIKAMLRGVDLRLEAPTVLPPIAATDEHMERLLYNLIDNAIKYTDPEDHVTVTLRTGDNCVIGEVADSGIGIAPKDVGRIFEQFYRAGNAKEVEPYGSGLGLCIVKRVVDLYGGRLRAHSELGEGSRFVFSFPTMDMALQPAGEEETSDA